MSTPKNPLLQGWVPAVEWCAPVTHEKFVGVWVRAEAALASSRWFWNVWVESFALPSRVVLPEGWPLDNCMVDEDERTFQWSFPAEDNSPFDGIPTAVSDFAQSLVETLNNR